MPVAVGIDLAAGRGTTEVTALAFDDTNDGLGPTDDAHDWRAPRWLREAHQATQSDDEIVAAACACAPSVIAIDAPLSLPAAVAAALGLGDVLATSAGVAPHPSPYTRAAERDPVWRTLGVRPFPVSFLGGLTFRALTLLPRLRAGAPTAKIIEVFPTATLAALGIRYEKPPTPTSASDTSISVADAKNAENTNISPNTTPLAARSSPRGRGQGEGRPPAKTTPVRRAATQTALTPWIDGLPDPTTDLLGADLLDALAAALTAVAYARGRHLAVGDPAEGQIILPAYVRLDTTRLDV